MRHKGGIKPTSMDAIEKTLKTRVTVKSTNYAIDLKMKLRHFAFQPKFLSRTGYRVLLWWRRARRNCAEWSFPFKQLQRGRTSPQECNMRCSALHPLKRKSMPFPN